MKWIKWALAEAGFRTVSMTLQKVIGNISRGLPQVVVSTLVIGAMQCLAASIVLRTKRINPLPGNILVLGSVLFGVGAFVNTVIAFMAYVYGANIAVYTFITLLAIVPGAMIDRVFFSERLIARQYMGIAGAIIAGWLILKTPSLAEVTLLPVWVWLGIANAFGLAVNQGISRRVKNVNPWVKNFWGGLTTFILCLTALAIFGNRWWGEITSPDIVPVLLWSIAISVVVIGIWTFNVIAYRDGGSIPTKHVVVNGTFLTLVTIVGFVIFGDEITTIQFGGMAIYLGAFVLINNEVWTYLAKPSR